MIIRSLMGLACFTAVTAADVARAQQAQIDTPAACVSCVILHVPAGEVTALPSQAALLAGLTVVVDADEPAAADALAALNAAGAGVGIVTTAAVPAPLSLLPGLTTVIVRGVADDDASVFAVRTVATALRGAKRDVRILIEGRAIPERLRAYVDGRVDPGPQLVRPSTPTLIDASRQGAEAEVLVRIRDVDWRAVGDFASQRAIGTEVVAAGVLTVEQIVARHQAQRRKQDALVRRTIARGTTTLMFEVPGFIAPVTVTAETIIYRQPDVTEMEQRNIRVNGTAIAGGSATSPPQLPLIEPERVATPPLLITLNDAYSYTLVGKERLDEGEAYVVRFESRGASPGAPHGRAWIDGVSFAVRRLETVQAGLQGAIVSSEQHETFAAFAIGEERAWLPVVVRIYQRYEGAGHRTPIHRTIETPAYDINPSDFDARLQAAYASPHVMLRETPQGFRYLLRPRGTEGATREVVARAGERIRTAVFGLLVDPNITVPLPFAGFSYVDLNLLDTGAQLNVFFGGTYGQLSWSLPSIGGTRWQAHGRAFAIAASYNDRAFRSGVEQYRENITQRPAHFSAGITRPVAFRLRARFDYELDYTAFDRADTTAAQFVVPGDALVHGLVAALEGESGPWSVRGWWNPARRQRWIAWGLYEGTTDQRRGADDLRTFQRFGVALARTLALGTRVTSRVETAWMDGRDLDRFSRYSFGAFENRLRGYPTASLRYDRGGVLRSVTSWAARGFRLDGFGDIAVVRDPGFGERLRGYPGVGAAVEVGGPFRTLWSVEWGYGFKARRSDGSLGTQAVRVTAYRTF